MILSFKDFWIFTFQIIDDIEINEKETYIGKTKGDNTKGFKVRIN